MIFRGLVISHKKSFIKKKAFSGSAKPVINVYSQIENGKHEIS